MYGREKLRLKPNDIGHVNRDVVKAWKEERAKEVEEEEAAKKANKKPVKKMRGKNKALSKLVATRWLCLRWGAA